MASLPIRLVTFDLLYTLIVPRLPIHVQYSQAFEPYLGVLDPESLRQSFGVAFRSLEREQPVYSKGSRAWWSEVIRRTALGAGANETALAASLPEIVPGLLHRFSSKEGYRAYDDALPALHALRQGLNVHTAAVSNADSRIRLVLQDLGFRDEVDAVVLSEEVGFEKPSPEIFLQALSKVNSSRSQNPIAPEECLHVGDEIDSDYEGALAANMKALLLRRAGRDGEQAHKPPQELSSRVQVVGNLHAVALWVKNHNSTRLGGPPPSCA
ncbi:putative HAD-hyrolase-like [Lyophyllum shimeji]|uniref:HAD-hyrolase-like n=1 Tax=Lyophyllum shimeji TaxID=47721 RepID=A0A9P3UN69_LYOSH|nr:putative HAD-hyrolase-like [Lyophyllum shimeji]